MPGDKCTAAGILTSLEDSEGGDWREKRLIITGLRDEWSGMMNRLHVMGRLLIMAILSVEMRCLSDVVLKETQEEPGSSRRAVISVNLAAKWRVWHVVSVWRAQRETSPLCTLWSSSHTLTSNTVRGATESMETTNRKTEMLVVTHNFGERRRLWQREGTRWRREESIFKLCLKTHKQT